MEGLSAAEYTFKRNHQVITLDTKSAVKIDGNMVQIDPQLLFQRLTLAAKQLITLRMYSSMSSAALFDTSVA